MSFLPPGYAAPKKSGSYLKFEDGKTKVRILTNPVLGYKYMNSVDEWVYSREEPKVSLSQIKTDKFGNKRVIHFWNVYAWDYSEKAVKIWEITQARIQAALEEYYVNEDWGSPLEYDITINKVKTNIIEYSVLPSPKKDLSDEVAEAFKSEKLVNFEDKFNAAPAASSAGDVEIDDLPFS